MNRNPYPDQDAPPDYSQVAGNVGPIFKVLQSGGAKKQGLLANEHAAPPSESGGSVKSYYNQMANAGNQFKEKVQTAIVVEGIRHYTKPLFGEKKNEDHPAVKEAESGGVWGFMKKQALAGRQFVPNITAQKGDDGAEIVEVTTKVKIFLISVVSQWLV
jgi:hypothetical protein